MGNLIEAIITELSRFIVLDDLDIRLHRHFYYYGY